MSREDLERLLGGYATNTLTDQERKELFEAALGDQTLFNALIDEQALKEVLDEPRSRRLLIEALRDRQARASGIERLQAWVRSWAWSGVPTSAPEHKSLSWRAGSSRVPSWRRPATWALAGSVAVALLAVTLVVRLTGPLPDTSMRTASKVPIQPSSPITPPESQPVPQNSETDKAQAPPSGFEDRTSQPLKRAPASRFPQLRDKSSSALGKKDEPLSPALPSVADERVASSPGPIAKREQEVRTTEGTAPAPGVGESVSPGEELKPERSDTAQGKGQAKATEERAIGAPREQARRFSPMASSATPADERKNQAPGVQYSVLQQRADGTYSEVSPTTTFASNDKARVAIEPKESGYLYVLEQDAAGNAKLVFPPAGAPARVEKSVRYFVPPSGAFSFQEPGDVLLTIISSPEQLEDPQNLQNFKNLRGSFMTSKKRKTERGAGIVEEGAGTSAPAQPPAPSRIDAGPNISKQELTLKHH